MEKRELHELLDMALAIGSSSKHFVNIEFDTREYTENELRITVYIFEHEKWLTKGVCDSLDIKALTVPTKVWLEAWATIVKKERESDAVDRP